MSRRATRISSAIFLVEQPFRWFCVLGLDARSQARAKRPTGGVVPTHRTPWKPRRFGVLDSMVAPTVPAPTAAYDVYVCQTSSES
jgi:predicted secreted protein